MSDISIPGINSRYKTEETVAALVEAERTRLEPMEEALTLYEAEKATWMDLNRQFSSLQTSAKFLFSFENPFYEKSVSSSNENILTALADRDADFSEYEMTVLQTAKSDRFFSNQLDDDYRVPEGLYTFQVGEEEVSLNYRGGRLNDFARRINDKAEGLIHITVVKNRADSQVMLVEAIPTGSSNRLFFGGDSEALALDAGLIRRAPSESRTVNFQNSNSIQQWNGELDMNKIDISNEEITLQRGASLSLPIDNYATEDGSVLTFEARVTNLSDDQVREVEPTPPGEITPPSINYEGIVIESEGTAPTLPDWPGNETPERIDDMNIVSINDGSRDISLPALGTSETWQTVTIPLKSYLENLRAINLQNNNSHREISIRNINVTNPMKVGDFEPVNPADSAMDAIIDFNGIEVIRESNEIDDLIPGVSLSLHGSSDEQIDLKVEPDVEAAKDAIIEFTYKYNKILEKILILTTDNQSVIDELEYLTEDEREDAQEELGSMRGDITLMQVKSRLQSLMSQPYQTREGQDLTLLSQLGVSTNETRSTGGSIDMSRLRGYLEINEDKLDLMLNRHLLAAKELFGYDTDGDYVTDSGVGYELDRYLNSFTTSGGILALRTDRLDRQIEDKQEQIDDFNEYLVDYEQDLKEEYGQMEGALNSLQSSSSYLNNLNNNNNNR